MLIGFVQFPILISTALCAIMEAKGGVKMDCGKNLEQLVPLIAAVKLSQIDGIKQMSDQELICKSPK